MEHNQATVLRQPQIQFHGIGALLPAKLHGGQRVFRRICRGAAMGNDFHGADSARQNEK